MIPRLAEWSNVEKAQATAAIRAKAGAKEAKYLRLLQRHIKLRNAMIRLGSKPAA